MKNDIVKIEFPLPFHIPIEEENTAIINYENIAAIKFQFHHVKNESLKAVPEIEEVCTLIKLELTPNNEPVGAAEENLLRFAVEFSIIALNDFIDAFRLESNSNYIKNFNITDLPPSIEIVINGTETRYFTTPTTMIQKGGEFDTGAFIRTHKKIEVWYENRQFEVIDKFLSRGIHHLYTEEFTFAIVELQTSFESYIRLCHRIILTKKDKREEDINKAQGIAFRNTIEDHLGPALGANLKFEENSIVKEWSEKLYKLRNSIVHSGESYISGDTAYEAFDSLENVVNHITQLMIDNGFMDEAGRVEIKALNKNTPSHVDKQEMMEELKKRGFI